MAAAVDEANGHVGWNECEEAQTTIQEVFARQVLVVHVLAPDGRNAIWLHRDDLSWKKSSKGLRRGLITKYSNRF